MNASLALMMIAGAIWSAVVASGKNRNVIGWMLLGLFMPVVGVVAIYCLPPAATPATPTEGTPTTT